MESGQKIIIKPFDVISAQKDEKQTFHFANGFHANGLFFNIAMEMYCGNIVTLKTQVLRHGAWRVEENGCYWHEEWFERTNFFTEDDFEI